GCTVLVGQHDDGSRADEAPVWRESVKVERDVCQRRRQHPASRAAGKVPVKRVPVQHPSAVLVDELLQRDTCRREVDTRPPDAAAHGEGAQSLATMAAMACETARGVL